MRPGLRNILFGGQTIVQQAIKILQRFGTNAHVYLPGVGVLNGLTAGNYLLNDGSTGLGSQDQPVGLMLDAGNSVLGAELVTNGGFADATGWTAGTGWTIGSGVASAAGSTADGLRDGISAYTTGKTYLVSFDKTGSASNVTAYVRGGSGCTFSAITSGRFSCYLVAGAGAARGVEFYNSSAVAITIDNISVREVTGIHATQATQGYRPYLRKGPVNLLLQSGQFDTTWSAVRGTPTESGVSSTGHKNWLFTINTDSNTHALTQAVAITSGATYTWSVEVKPGTLGFTSLLLPTTAFPTTCQAFFNATTGAVVSVSGATASATTVLLSNGSYRCSITATANASASASFIMYACEVGNNTSITTAGSKTFNFANAQLELGSTATTYIPTTTVALSSGVGNYYHAYDGSDDRMVLGSVPWAVGDDHFVIVGASCNTSGVSPVVTITGAPGISSRYPALYFNTGNTFFAAWRDNTNTGVAPSVGITLNTPYVMAVRAVAGTIYCDKNGVQFGTGALSGLGATTIPSNGGAIGYTVASSFYHAGAIYPAILGKGTLGASDFLILQKFVGLLTGPTGVTVG